MSKVVIAMSGGVDSSVAAGLLVQQGHQVTGMMLRLWSEPGAEGSNRCCTPDAMALARRVAAKLDIPFYAIDAQEPFYNRVVNSFVQGYADGVTPNPCLTCNRFLRWGFLLDKARAIGADHLATGHYARTYVDDNEKAHLLHAVDRNKDQSYVLSVLNQEQLSHSIYPLGGMTKPEVRAIAREMELPVAERADSQDLCFLAGEDYRSFLKRHLLEGERPGPIRDRVGNTLGEHQGLANYTIGQRKGLGLASGEPLYVLEKDLDRNELVIGKQSELGKSSLTGIQANWIAGAPPADNFTAEVKIRYKAPLVPGQVSILTDGKFKVEFNLPLRDITPGQAAVLYNGEECLGGGIIQS